MKISIWGNELPAWTAAAALAECGNHVFLVTNIDESAPQSEHEFKISNEPGLKTLVQSEQENGRFVRCTAKEALNSNTHILALNPDQYAHAESLIKQLSDIHSSNLLIINQSNFGVGSSEKLQALLNEDDNQAIGYVPDMLAEGSALKNFKAPETIIIGCDNEWANLNIKAILRPFSKSVKQWLVMTPKEAEFTKFANTGMLALRLSYINEIANLADQLEVNIEVIREAMISDPRIGPHYLRPGCGFGGLHFQQYISGLSELMADARNSKLLDTVLIENEKQKEQPFRKLWRHYQCDLEGKIITLWGLSFKPGTASIDNSPSLKVIETLLAQNCHIHVHDPEAMDNIKSHFGEQPAIKYFDDNYEALKGSEGLLLLTDWLEYASPDYDHILSLMKRPLIIDGRNLFNKELLINLGFSYYGVGQ